MADITGQDMTWQEFQEQFPYGAVVLKDDTIVHIVGYTHVVSEQDCMLLAKELEEDPEFGLTDLRDYHIIPLAGADWHKYGQLFFEG